MLWGRSSCIIAVSEALRWWHHIAGFHIVTNNIWHAWAVPAEQTGEVAVMHMMHMVGTQACGMSGGVTERAA
jgi:hypothetical protein